MACPVPFYKIDVDDSDSETSWVRESSLINKKDRYEAQGDCIPRFQEAISRNVSISENQRPYYTWHVKGYLQFCRQHNLPAAHTDSRNRFSQSLQKRGAPAFQLRQVWHAIELFWGLFQPKALNWVDAQHKLLEEIKLRHYSLKTLKAYSHWVRTFQTYLDITDPASLNSEMAKKFLSHLALERKVAASTQNQAFNALLFFFQHVIKVEYRGLEDTPRGKLPKLIPSVLSREEIAMVFDGLAGPYILISKLLYGCGLRLGEAISLRVQDVDFALGQVEIHGAKGQKSRRIPLPAKLVGSLQDHLLEIRKGFELDLQAGYSGVFLPQPLEVKYPGAAKQWGWQWLFPARHLTPTETGIRRYHIHETAVQKEISRASAKAGINKRVTPHTFRHSYATHLIHMGHDIRTVQELMGHQDVKTTMIYAHTLQAPGTRVMSPLDL